MVQNPNLGLHLLLFCSNPRASASANLYTNGCNIPAELALRKLEQETSSCVQSQNPTTELLTNNIDATMSTRQQRVTTVWSTGSK